MKWISRVSVFVFALTVSHQVGAWGNDGHRITGYIADQLLSPKARIKLNQIMQGELLSTAATYPDAHKQELDVGFRYRGSRAWHFDDRPPCGSGSPLAQKAQWCPDRNCASDRIPELLKDIADVHSSPMEKKMGVRFVAHFVGDIHQPMHTAEYMDDRGGNMVHVFWQQGTTKRSGNLHSFWDTDMVRMVLRGQSETGFAASLIKKYEKDIPGWQSGTLENWIMEAHQIAREQAYGALGGFSCGNPFHRAEIGDDYISKGKDIVERQLVKAGVRIAHYLNRILDE